MRDLINKFKKDRKVVTKNSGFTLAEVLITLGIIGVVAAITITTFTYNIKTKQTVTRLKKVNSELNQAYQFAIEENGTPDLWGLATMSDEITHKIIATNISKYINLTENCIDMTDSSEVQKKCKTRLTRLKSL